MLNWKIFRLGTLLVFSVLLILQFWHPISHWFFVLPLLMAVVYFVHGTCTLSANLHFRSLCRSEMNERKVTLTFDDGPCPIQTHKILDILKSEDVKATFFCVGKNVAKHPEIINRMVREGHSVGNHSWNHSWNFPFHSRNSIKKNIASCGEALFKACGKEVKLFRPPFGVASPTIGGAIADLSLISIGWNIRSFDTVIKNRGKILRRIGKQLKPGSIILLHDTLPNAHFLLTDLLKYLKDNQYAAVSLNNLFGLDEFEK